MIPVSINFSVSFGYPAIGSTDIGISVVIRGHNQGIYTTRSYSDQWILAHGGVGFNAGASWYDGDLRYFNFEKLYEANAVGWEADLGFWGVASQVTYADEFGGQLWTGELGLLGFGFGFTKDIPTGNADPWLIYGN